jgi:hypothetical protein
VKMKTLMIGAVAAITGSTYAQSLMNGSFETEGPGFVAFTSWMNFGNVFAADMGEVVAQDGMLSAKMFGASSGDQSDQVLEQSGIPATAGEQYTLTTYCQNLSSDALGAENLILAQMVFRDSGGADLGIVQHDAISIVSDPMDQWVRKDLVAVAPAGTDSIAIFLLHIQLPDANQGGGASFWDNVSLTEGDAPCSNPADLNGDGELNFFDVSQFLTLYSQGC